MRPNAISPGGWMLPDMNLGLFITTNVLAYLELDPLNQTPVLSVIMQDYPQLVRLP